MRWWRRSRLWVAAPPPSRETRPRVRAWRASSTRPRRSSDGIDLLVNNAGVLKRTPFLELDEAEWDWVLDINLKGYFLVGQAVARRMAARGAGGAIVNVSSAGQAVAAPSLAHYCVSKAGVEMLTKQMALELAPHRIRVNAISPGLIETDMNREDIADPAFRERRMARIPLKEIGAPEDLVVGRRLPRLQPGGPPRHRRLPLHRRRSDHLGRLAPLSLCRPPLLGERAGVGACSPKGGVQRGVSPSGKGSGGCAPSYKITIEGGRVGPPNAEHSPSPSRRASDPLVVPAQSGTCRPPPQAEGAGLALPALLPGRRGPNSPQRPHSPTKDHLAASRTRQGESRGGFPPLARGLGDVPPVLKKRSRAGGWAHPTPSSSPPPAASGG